MTKDDIITVTNIKKNFGQTQVLKGLSFTVKTGEVLSIIGPSGSGKSTILRCLSQLEEITNGSIYICNKTLVKDSIYTTKDNRRKIALDIGLVFQNFNLFPHFSVLSNITNPLIHVLKLSKKQAIQRAEELLSQVGLIDKANNYPCELSGGQQQRISIARAMSLRPRVLLFDEPTSALDPELTGEILAVIKGLTLQKMTMIVVTHEISFAKDISDNIIFMENGIIVESGKGNEVICNPKVQRTKEFLARYNA